MDALIDPNSEDTAPALKAVKMSDDPLTPPSARSIQRVDVTRKLTQFRKPTLMRTHRQELSSAVRQEPQTGSEKTISTPLLLHKSESGAIQDMPTQVLPVNDVARLSYGLNTVVQDMPTHVLPVNEVAHLSYGPNMATQDMPTHVLPAVVVQEAIKGQAKKGKKKSPLGTGVRAIVTVLLFVFLLKSMDWSTLVPTITHIRHSDLLLGLSAGVVCLLFSSYGWRSVVLAENIQTDLARLIELYLVGVSFSHFLPTSMGGDAVKAYYVGRDSGNTPGAASAVLMSRITSFVGMLLIALPALAILHARFTDQIVIWFLLLSLLLIAAIIGSVLAAIFIPRLSSRFLKGKGTQNSLLVKVLALMAKFLSVGEALSSAFRRPRSMISAILFGMLFWGASFLNYYGYALALGLHVSLTFYVIAIPFVSIIAALPISINGFGVREGAFVYLFTTIHVLPAKSLSLALLMDAQVLFFGFIGGFIYFTMSGKKREDHNE